jgi:hypothetical protein
VCRCRRRRVGIVGRNEQPRDRTARTTSLSHLDHRSDEKTHHVMEKTVCCHFEHPTTIPLHPPGMLDEAAVVIVGWRRVSDRKRAEGVVTQDTVGFALQGHRVERVTHGPLIPATERGSCRLIRADKITVSSRDGAPAGVKVGNHPMRRRDPDIVRENRVQGAAEGIRVPARGHPHTDALAVRVNAGIGSAGADGGNGGGAESPKGHFHIALHRADDGLALPAGEAPPVILRYQEDRSRVHDLDEGRQHSRSLQLTRAESSRTIAPSRPLTFPPLAMPPRSLSSLAHALSATSDLDGALIALGECLAELDRGASVALLQYDARRDMLRDRLTPVGARVIRTSMETTFDHLPEAVRTSILAGGPFIDVSERSADYARLCGFTAALDGGILAVRGLKVEGLLGAVLALYEPRKIFGTRTTERLAPAVALFDLAYVRLAERDAREEAVRTLEDVTQRVHGEYVRKLTVLETELREVRSTPRNLSAMSPAEAIALRADAARSAEEARRALRRSELADQQFTAAVGQLEQAHVELHRRSEALRQRTRTLFLLDRALSLDAETVDARTLVDGLLALVGDDMQAQRCSLMLRAPEPDYLYLAAARGIAPNIVEGMRIRIGEGVAGRVAAAREPLLVRDVRDAAQHPLLHDQYFTTGSFISFPLVYHDELVGVLNLTNRAQRGIYSDEDVERVRLLGLVISLIMSRNALPERLLDSINVS